MVTQEVKFDLLNQKQDKPILCRYGEDGRTIYGTVINSDDEEHTVNLNNFTGIKIQMYKPDGNFVIKDATVSSGRVVIPIDEQMTACAGTGFMDLKLTAIDGTIYTCHATVIIDTPVTTDDTIESLSVVNGYVFPDDFQLKLSAGTGIYFTGDDMTTINATGEEYTEGTGIDITGNVVSIDQSVLDDIDGKQDELSEGTGIDITGNVVSIDQSVLDDIDGKQEQLTAGEGIEIEGNVISTTGSGGGDVNTYSTTETAVGTWIDGRIIYRKVYTGLNVTLDSVGRLFVGVYDSSVNKVINALAWEEEPATGGVDFMYNLATAGVVSGNIYISAGAVYNRTVNTLAIDYVKAV